MSVRIFNLRGVPDDEAEDIRELLSNHSIDYYETPAGNWGISMPSLWLQDREQFDQARQLIDSYQAQRSERVRAEHAQLRNEGKHRTFFDEIRQHPLRVLVYVLFGLVILYFSTKPFIGLGQ
jgi:hypothetical protein